MGVELRCSRRKLKQKQIPPLRCGMIDREARTNAGASPVRSHPTGKEPRRGPGCTSVAMTAELRVRSGLVTARVVVVPCRVELHEAEAAVGDGEVAEAEGEGFGSAAAFDEFGEFELDDVKAGVEEAGG